MDRISDLERKYVNEALDNEFRSSKRSVFNRRLEVAFLKRFEIDYAISHANGTCTLHSALAACDVGPGDEVIVPALTMSSPALAVLQNQSIPVFADVDPFTFTLDPESVRQCITSKTKAVISVSLYGQPPDYSTLMNVCHENKLFHIHDNALSFSGQYYSKGSSLFGHFASYSFQGSKQLSAGEGGMLITYRRDLAEKARRFSRLGFNGTTAWGSTLTKEEIQDPNFDRHLSLGFNYKMSELSAAVALAQVERADELIGQRMAVAEMYHQALNGVNFFMPQASISMTTNDYWSFALVIHTDHPETDWYRFRDLFKKNGGDGFYAAWKLSYNEPLFQQEVQYYDGVWQQYGPELCPQAEYLQPRLIQLKTNYWNLDDAEKQAEILHKTLSGFSI
jgi:perosamine synthetase